MSEAGFEPANYSTKWHNGRALPFRHRPAFYVRKEQQVKMNIGELANEPCMSHSAY